MLRRFLSQLRYKSCNYEKRAALLRKKGVKIGKNTQIWPSVNFGSEPYLIEIGNNVRITSNVELTTHDGGLWVLRNNGMLKNGDKFGRIKIGDNVHIGKNTIVMPGVTIGDNVVIGVSSVVTKDVPSNTVVAGVPARVIETIDEYYNKNKDKVVLTKNMSSKEKKEYLIKKYNIER